MGEKNHKSSELVVVVRENNMGFAWANVVVGVRLWALPDRIDGWDNLHAELSNQIKPNIYKIY